MTSDSIALMAFRRMCDDPMQGGEVAYDGEDYACTVGVFKKQFDLTTGGLSPNATATLEVYLPDFPDGTEFVSKQIIDVTKIGGSVRNCEIESVTEQGGGIYQLEVKDLNQSA